jgi:hypothetical protein
MTRPSNLSLSIEGNDSPRDVSKKTIRSSAIALMLVVLAVVLPFAALLSSRSSSPATTEHELLRTASRSLASTTITSSATLANVVSRGVLLCGVAEYLPGVSFVNPKTNQRAGINVDLVSQLQYCRRTYSSCCHPNVIVARCLTVVIHSRFAPTVSVGLWQLRHWAMRQRSNMSLSPQSLDGKH